MYSEVSLGAFANEKMLQAAIAFLLAAASLLRPANITNVIA